MQKLNEGTKFDSDKIRLELVPSEFLFATASVLTKGAEKYEEWNWAKGIKYSRVIGALLRHIGCWAMGRGPTTKSFMFGDLDSEWGFSHLWHASCCLAFLICYEEWGRDDLDDRYDPNRHLTRTGDRDKMTQQGGDHAK